MAGSVTFAATGISSCQNITEPGEYVLAGDIVSPSGDCITIPYQSDVVLDCGPYTITSETTPDSHAVHAYAGTNITIRNCEFIDFAGSVLFRDIDDSVIRNVSGTTIRLEGPHGSDNNLVTGNNIAGSNGIFINTGVGNNITDNTIQTSSLALFVGSETGNINVIGNNIEVTTGPSAAIEMGSELSGSAVIDNTVKTSGAGSVGIGAYSNNLVVSGNTVDGADGGSYGIYVYGSNITIENCDVSNYTYTALYIDSSSNTVVSNSQFHDSGTGIDASNSDVFLNEVTSYNNDNYGFNVASSYDAGIFNSRAYNNGIADVRATNSLASIPLLNVGGLILDNPSGTMEDYVNLSFYDFIDQGETYELSWTSSDTPAGYDSFNNMYVDVVSISGPASIDSVQFSWTADQETGYNVSELEIWQKDTSWTMLTSTIFQRHIFTNIVGEGILGVFVPSGDGDGDGVPDELDKCDGTVPDVIPDLTPGSYYLGPDGVIYDENGPTEYTALDTYGCSVEQIMYCKPGNNQGESTHGMTPGTLNVWMKQIAWATDCQVDGAVALQGVQSTLPDVDVEQDGKPDWWCEEHPNKC